MLTTGIILQTRDYGEADELAVFFSKELGRMTGIAKNARRSRWRFAGHIEPLSVTELLLRQRKKDNLVWIDECCVRSGHLNLRHDIFKVAWAEYFVELTCIFSPEGHPDPPIYDFVCEFLDELDASNITPVRLIMQELRFLGLLGYMPRFDKCPICGKELIQGQNAYFDPRAGGACHPECTTGPHRECIKLSPAALAVANRAASIDKVAAARIRLHKQSIDELRSALTAFVRCLRGGEIHALLFMEKLNSWLSDDP